MPALLLSAGSEVVSVSLAEELAACGVPFALISFGQNSVLAGVPELVAYERVEWPASSQSALAAILRFASPLAERAGSALPVFATDDATLRLLLEHRSVVEHVLRIPRATALRSGGLDKAEFFDFLRANGLADLCPRSVTIRHPRELREAFDELGTDVVIKPTLKPFRAQLALDTSGRKLLAASAYASPAELSAALTANWSFSDAWLVQERLQTPPEGEAVAWVARSKHGQIRQISAVERWKHPRVGGTGCWLETRVDPEIDLAGRRLAEALGLEGLAEFPFLKDSSGAWRVLECNPRAWLQVALARIAGRPLAAFTWATLCDREANGNGFSQPPVQRTWISAELLLLAAASGNYGSRSSSFGTALGLLKRADYTAMHSSPWGFVQRAWVRRVGGKLVRRTVGQ
ncbi:MAG TPA: hypothetical protein VGI10_20835 [Polyangiaceae bacterium]